MTLLFVLLIVFALLMVSEYWWHKHPEPSEYRRKFVHITVGSFVAFWPFFLTWNQITICSLAFLFVVLISKRIGLFDGIYSVNRVSWGEISFALAVGMVAMITRSEAIYAVAILHMSLADGLAAVVGTKFGDNNQYQVFQSKKSVAGTATFMLVSAALLVAFSVYSDAQLSPAIIAGLALAGAAIENVGVYGLDNLLVPLLIAYALELAT